MLVFIPGHLLPILSHLSTVFSFRALRLRASLNWLKVKRETHSLMELEPGPAAMLMPVTSARNRDWKSPAASGQPGLHRELKASQRFRKRTETPSQKEPWC